MGDSLSPAATDEKSKPKPACFVHGVIGTEHVDEEEEGILNDSDVGRGRLRDSERSSAAAAPGGGGGIVTFELSIKLLECDDGGVFSGTPNCGSLARVCVRVHRPTTVSL